MDKIETTLKDGILTIRKIRTRINDNDIENIDISNIVYNEKYSSKVNITNEESKNKIFLIEELNDFTSGEIKNALIVYSDNNKIFYKIGSLGSLYKIFVKVFYKVLKISINKKYFKIKIFAYLKNKYELNIEDINLSVDSNNYKKVNLKNYINKKSKVKMLLEGNVYNFKFKISDLLDSNEGINNCIFFNLRINNTDIKYKVGIRDKRINNKKKQKRYYNLPMKSIYTKNFAIHIRRTIEGNLVLVKRMKEPIEETIKFKILENRIVSFVLYNMGKLFNKIRRKNINIFYEKFASKAEEGVYELYKKCSSSKISKNYFIIDKNSEDYEDIKSDRNVIKKYTLKYYWVIYNCRYFIASEAPSHLNVLRSSNKYFRKATYDKKFVFLQHGIIFMKNLEKNSTFLKGKEAEPDYMVVSSEYEKEVVMDMLKIKEEKLIKTGLALFSKLEYKHINKKSKDFVTIMLTWKPYEESLYDFKESSYYKNMIEVYDELKKYIKDDKIAILPHPKVFELLNSTDMGQNIWKGKISECLEQTKLLITDYSSVCYNSFYQGAGVIFYQPDIEKYEFENGKLVPNDNEYIGYRAFNLNNLHEILQNAIRNEKINLKYIRNNVFEKRYKLINEFSDGNNIDRIYQELIKLSII